MLEASLRSPDLGMSYRQGNREGLECWEHTMLIKIEIQHDSVQYSYYTCMRMFTTSKNEENVPDINNPPTPAP